MRFLFFQVPAILLITFAVVYLASCTLSIINTSTEGQASDVIDNTPKTDANVSPDINIPSPLTRGI